LEVAELRTEMMHGISVIICCHNSAARLSATLRYLRRQEVSPSIPWEIIVVDNASTDGTADVALDNWPKDSAATLRVVYEPRLGLSHARTRGFSEAKYEIVSFIDDDNWVSPNWIQLVSEIMVRHPDMGACGGYTEAVCEITPPSWFESYKRFYAIGAQANESGDISHKKGFLWGAGLSIRKTAWQQLVNHGFRPLLVDRQGTALSTGGDAELSYALRLAGWGLWYDPRLQSQHFLPADRFDWRYLRRLFRGVGAASVFHDLYHYALRGNPETFIEQLKRTWQWKILAAFTKLLLYDGKSFLSFYSAPEGNPDILRFEARIGRLSELVRARKAYQLAFRKSRSYQF
jgi:glycosyltransferase involved in cell wall biosynthesis